MESADYIMKLSTSMEAAADIMKLFTNMEAAAYIMNLSTSTWTFSIEMSKTDLCPPFICSTRQL